MKTLPKAYLQAIQNIKAKGFSHIKLELEAHLNRGNAEANCQECEDGYVTCDYCSGDGYLEVEVSNGDLEREECSDCGGEGTMDCYNCNGRGRSRDGVSTSWCQDFIEEHMGAQARRALVYGRFYDDGSVDSEYTFTMPIEKAHLCLEVIRAFNELNHNINGGGAPDVDNAGMHLSVLPEGNYPCRSNLLNASKMENFRREVTKLLPALYFLSTHTTTTRRLNYRMPQVSHDDKYSAIFTHGDTCMEFRIFDTCYDKPEALLEKIQVVASTLKYYSDEKVAIKYRAFTFPDEYSGNAESISYWFKDLASYDALNQTIKHLKPANKSVKALKSERNLKCVRKTLLKNLQDSMTAYKSKYAQYRADIENLNARSAENFYRSMTRAVQNIEGRPLRYIFTTNEVALFGPDLEHMEKFLANKARALKFIRKHAKELSIRHEKVLTLRQFVLVQISESSGPVLRPFETADNNY